MNFHRKEKVFPLSLNGGTVYRYEVELDLFETAQYTAFLIACYTQKVLLIIKEQIVFRHCGQMMKRELQSGDSVCILSI